MYYGGRVYRRNIKDGVLRNERKWNDNKYRGNIREDKWRNRDWRMDEIKGDGCKL